MRGVYQKQQRTFVVIGYDFRNCLDVWDGGLADGCRSRCRQAASSRAAANGSVAQRVSLLSERRLYRVQ